MSKSKEDIVREQYDKVFGSQKYDDSVNRKMNASYFFPSMDEYNRQQAIAFAEWMASEGYVTYDGFDRWIAPHNNNNVYSANELYSMFLTHQSQQNKQL
jgi:hypothetical protein